MHVYVCTHTNNDGKRGNTTADGFLVEEEAPEDPLERIRKAMDQQRNRCARDHEMACLYTIA